MLLFWVSSGTEEKEGKRQKVNGQLATGEKNKTRKKKMRKGRSQSMSEIAVIFSVSS